ncbi:MAG: hypothetical protein QXG05_05120 [Nitrososphaerota archaeon]
MPSRIKIDFTLIVIVLIGIITVSGFTVAALNYSTSQNYPPWVHPNLHKPAMIYVPVVNGTIANTATLYNAYGNLLANLTFISSNSSFSSFSTGSYNIVTGYAYKVWVPQQNIVYDFGLQNPPIGQAYQHYYYVVLNVNMQDQLWRPTNTT